MPTVTEASALREDELTLSSAASTLNLPPVSTPTLPTASILVPFRTVSPLLLIWTLPPEVIEPPTSRTLEASDVSPDALTLTLPPTTLMALTFTVTTAAAPTF
jgi:hypothetical protein